MNVRRTVMETLLGIAVLSCIVGPSVVCGAIGYLRWGDPGVLLALAPIGAAVLALAAWQCGHDLLEDRK